MSFKVLVNGLRTAKANAIKVTNHLFTSIMQHGVRGFPTIKIFGANKGSPEDYQGDRTAVGIVQAAQRTAQKIVQDRLGGKSSGTFQFIDTNVDS